MTVLSTNRKAGPYVGTGSTSNFPFAFKVFSASDVVVIQTSTTGVKSVLVMGTDYTISLNPDQNAYPGGTLSTTSPLAAGVSILITSVTSLLQPAQLVNLGGFYPEVIEAALDRIVIMIQELGNFGGLATYLEPKTATAGQTVFTISKPYPTGANAVAVYCDGFRLSPSDFTETNSTTVTLASPRLAGEELLFVIGVESTPQSGTPAASAIEFTPAAPLTSSTVQAAILEAYSRAVSDAPGTGGGGVSLPFLNIKAAPYSATGDGTTNDTTAISTADAVAVKKYAPVGTYLTTIAPATLSGPFWGEGRIKDSSNNLRAPNFANAKAAPSTGNPASIETAFNGDLSKCQFPVEHRITGAATLGQPTTGYSYTPECFPHFTYMQNASGWNNATASNEGRTGAAAYYTVVEQAGQGDAMCYIGRAFVNSTKSGSTDFLANPAGVLFAGDVASSVDGGYLNPIEINSIDNGKDCAAVGAVFNMARTNKTGAKKVFWNGIRIQSVGTQPINSGFALTGLADSGLDFTRSTITNTGGIKPAILLKTGDCIMGNATPGAGYGDFTAGAALITYDVTAGWVMQVGGVPIFQANAAQALVAGKFIVAPVGGAIRLEVTDTVTTIGNSFKHTGTTFGFFNATPQVQYPGWGTPTSYGIVANFPGGTATLVQCGNAIGSIIAYLKAIGLFAA